MGTSSSDALIIAQNSNLNRFMPVFTCTGSAPKDLWKVDGSPDFAYFPGGVLARVPEPLPIRLKVGTVAYGETHILKRHGHWVAKQRMSVPELVYMKLGNSGVIYCTEHDDKFKISLKLNPTSLLILNLISGHDVDHFSVTSLYMHPSRLDGENLGRYPGRR